MKRPLRLLSLLYAALVVTVGLWALYVDITMLHSPREHLLPDMLLVGISAPSSLSLGLVVAALPGHFASPFVQLAWTGFCGLSQAAVLFVASWLIPARRSA